jgi:phosphoglycerate dehydrogenase-like enzyme
VITLMYSNFAPSAEHVRRLQKLAGSGRVAVAASEDSALTCAPSTQIVLGHRWLRQLLPHAPGLRWVQTSAAGYDQLPWAELARRGITLTRNPMNSASIANHAVALAWALLRRLPDALRAQYAGRWGAPFAMLPQPRTALVLGLGAIGMQVSRLLRGLGLHVRGTSNSGSAAQREACDEFVDAGRWRDALHDTDILVLALPLNETTRGCIGPRELAALPAHAVLVNIARDGLVDRTALLDALRSGRIGGAGLDALDPIPAADDPLWMTPNLLITPKVSAYHPGMQQEFEAFAELQTRRFLSGAPLEALVDLANTRRACA